VRSQLATEAVERPITQGAVAALQSQRGAPDSKHCGSATSAKWQQAQSSSHDALRL